MSLGAPRERVLAVADLVLDTKRYELDAAEPVLDRKYDGAVETDILRVRHALAKEMALSSTYGLDKRRSGYVDEKNVLIFDDVSLLSIEDVVLEFKNGGGVIRVLVLVS